MTLIYYLYVLLIYTLLVQNTKFFGVVYNSSLSKTRITLVYHSIVIKFSLMADLNLFFLKPFSKNNIEEALKEEHECKNKGFDG